MDLKFNKIILYISWIIFVFLVDKLKCKTIPEIENYKLELEWKYPFQSQSYLDILISTPVEKIISQQSYIQSYESFIEFGSFRMVLTLNKNEDIYKSILSIDSLLREFQKRLPDDVPMFHLSLPQNKEPDLILSVTGNADSSEEPDLINKKLIPFIKSTASDTEIIRFGLEEYEYVMGYSNPEILLQGLNPILIQNKYSALIHLNHESSLIDKKNVLSFRNIPIYNVRNSLVHPNLQLNKELITKTEFNRINSEKAVGISIYFLSTLENIYITTYLIKSEIYDIINSLSYFKLIDTNFHSLIQLVLHSNSEINKSNLKVNIIYNKTLSNILFIFNNGFLILIILNTLFIKISIHEKSCHLSINLLWKSIQIFPFIIITSYLYDKVIDFSTILAYSWFFILVSVDIHRTFRRVILATTTLIISILIIQDYIPEIYSVLYTKSAVLTCILAISLYLTQHNSLKKDNFLFRFFSFLLFRFLHSIITLLKWCSNPILKFTVIRTILEKISHLPIYILILIFVSIPILFGNSRGAFLPENSGNTEIGFLEMPPGTSSSVTDSISKRLEILLSGIPGVRRVYARGNKESVKYYIEIKNGFEFNHDTLNLLRYNSKPGYFYISTELMKRTGIFSLDLIGNNLKSLLKLCSKVSESINPEKNLEIIYRFKPPHSLLLVEPLRDKLSISNTFSNNFHLNSRLSQAGGIIGRVNNQNSITDLRIKNLSPFETVMTG